MRRLFSLALTVVCFLLVVVDLARIAQAQNAIFRGSRDVLLMVQMKVDHKGTIATATATKRSNESRKDAASALAAAGVDGAVAHYVAYADLDDTSAESTLQRALDAAPLPANGRVPGRVAHYIAFGDPNDPVVRALAKKFGLPVRESREAVKASDAQKPLRVSGLSEEDIKTTARHVINGRCGNDPPIRQGGRGVSLRTAPCA